MGRARADRQTDPPNLGVSKAVALPEPLLLLLLLSGTVLTLVPCQDGGQWAAAWGGPTTHPVPVPARAASVCLHTPGKHSRALGLLL